MKGTHKGFIWETERQKDLEFTDEPNKKIYNFTVKAEGYENWLYRDSWTCKKGVYESTETTSTETSQKRYAEDIIDRFAYHDFQRAERAKLLKEEFFKIMDVTI